MSARVLRVTVQLSEDELKKLMTLDVIVTNIDEVTPAGWTRRVLLPTRWDYAMRKTLWPREEA